MWASFSRRRFSVLNRFSEVNHLYFFALLLILVGNDVLLKYAYPGFITGKLSDVSGLLIFPVLMWVITGWKRTTIVLLTALGFVFWKSALSSPVIDWWNQHLPLHLVRTIDNTDLWCLLVVPFAFGWMKKGAFRFGGAPQQALLGFAAFWCVASNSDDVRFMHPVTGEPASNLDGVSIQVPRSGKPSEVYTIKVKNDTTVEFRKVSSNKKYSCNLRRKGDLYFTNKRHPLYPDQYWVIQAFMLRNDTVWNFTSMFAKKPYAVVNASHAERKRYFKDVNQIWSDANQQNIILINNTEAETYRAFKAWCETSEQAFVLP